MNYFWGMLGRGWVVLMGFVREVPSVLSGSELTPLPAFSLTACGGFRGFRTLRRAAMGSGSRLPARSVLLPPAEVSTGHPHPPGTLQPPQRLGKLLQSSAPAFTTVFPLYLVCTAENCNYYLSFLLLLGWRSFLRAFASI